MRVLVLTQIAVYPDDAGPKVKTLQVLRHLAARFPVVYCTFVRSSQERDAVEKLSEICERVATVDITRSHVHDARFFLESLVTNDSFILRRDESASMHAMIRHLLCEEAIDVLHVDQLNMMRFVPPEWRGTVILDEHNAVWQVVERLRQHAGNPLTRWLLKREVAIIRRVEGAACRRAQCVLAVSENDQQALREVAGGSASIEIVPITIDSRRFEEIWAARDPQPNKLFTVGTMFWPPNSEGVMWWLREGYDYLQKDCPAIVYDVVGARPPQTLRALAKKYSGVQLHGYVADLESFWKHATALAVPILSGGGVRVKILEAMAAGVPVISTTIGCEGLAVRDGEHLLIADTPAAFAAACAEVLQNPKRAHTLAHNARQLLLERYDRAVALRSLDAVYERYEGVRQ